MSFPIDSMVDLSIVMWLFTRGYINIIRDNLPSGELWENDDMRDGPTQLVIRIFENLRTPWRNEDFDYEFDKSVELC